MKHLPVMLCRRPAGRCPASVAVVAFLLGWLGLAPPPAVADELVIGGVTHRNLRVTGVRDGLLVYETAGGSRRQASLESVETIRLRRHPAMAEAEQLAEAGEFADAAARYRQVLGELERDGLAVLVHAKLVAALDAAGETEEAVQQYLELLVRDQGPVARSAEPRDLPAEREARDALAQQVRQQISRTADASARRPMQELFDRLEADADDDAGASSGGSAPLPGRPASGGDNNDAIDALIDRGEYREALEAVEQAIEQGRGSLAQRLHQRGVILSELGEDREAALSLMRVVIHYPSPRNPYHIPSLIEAGKVFVDLEQPAHARRLWDEARQAANEVNDEEKLTEIDQLIGSLP